MKKIENEKKSGVPLKITMKIMKNGKMVTYYRQTKQREFQWYFNRAKKRNFDYIYFRVNYTKELDVHNKMVSMRNDMDCYSIEDLKWAYRAFYKEYL